MSRNRQSGTYPENWKEIANAVKIAANWRCVRCGHKHDPGSGHTLTVHHADNNKSNCQWYNLLPLCQWCHLSVQARVDLDRPWVMAEHSEWFKPFVGGYFAWKYLGEVLSRDEVMDRLPELLDIERRIVLGAS